MIAHLPPELKNAVDVALGRLEQAGFARRLAAKETDLWRSEPEHQAVARTRLGWLTVIGPMKEQAQRLNGLAAPLWDEGFRHAILLGMGGSSLCPEVLQATFPPAPRALDLAVLDCTSPEAVAAIETGRDLSKTLFIVSTKSGATIETLSFFRHFHDRLSETLGEQAGRNFIAVTDPGTPLAALAAEHGFREVFLNPPDIGGRYSALSFFGLAPAALIGLDIEKLLDRAGRMALACSSDVPVRDNPGLALGAALAGAAAVGRDKATFLLSPAIRTFGLWAEQLIAESTGKDGRGIIPVVDEPAAAPDAYRDDRLFVALRLAEDDKRELDERISALEAAGQPVITLSLEDRYDLGGEFFRWEYATAAAGFLMGIDPFDEPNVAEAKDRTGRLLDALRAEGGWYEGEPLLVDGDVSAYASPAAVKLLPDSWDHRIVSLEVVLEEIFEATRRRAAENPYLALLAYVHETPAVDGALQSLRKIAGEATGMAATLGYGPRYLHSTGQLHKGGPPKGIFLQITADDVFDLDVPGEDCGFCELFAAQAQGDFEALGDKGLPVLRLHLSGDKAAGMDQIRRAAEAAARVKARR